MAQHPVPHTDEWFKALEAYNPMQAAQSRQMVAMAGSNDVCSVCGDDPANDYQLTGEPMAATAVATIRLCDDCLGIRRRGGENLVPFP